MKTERVSMIRKRVRSRMKGLMAMLLVVMMAVGVMPVMGAQEDTDKYYLVCDYFTYKRSDLQPACIPIYFGKGNVQNLHTDNYVGLYDGSLVFNNMYINYTESGWIDRKPAELNQVVAFENVGDYEKFEVNSNTTLYYGMPDSLGYASGAITVVYNGVDQGQICGQNQKESISLPAGKYTLKFDRMNNTLVVFTLDSAIEIVLSPTTLDFTVGDAAKSLTVEPSTAKVIWSSDNKSVATVDENGKVTPVGVGTATITATLESDSSVKATCTVTVNAKKDAEPGAQPESQSQAPVNIQLNSNLFVRWKGNNVAVSWGTASGADSYEVWATYCGTSTFEKVMDVQSGNKATIKKLKGKKLNKKRGVKVYVVAKQAGANLGRTLYGHSASSKNPRTNAKKVMVKKKSYSLTVGQTAKIKATTVKEKSRKKLLHDGYYRYASSNTSVATVNSSGRITAVGAGACDVWVYALNGRSKKMTVTVK